MEQGAIFSTVYYPCMAKVGQTQQDLCSVFFFFQDGALIAEEREECEVGASVSHFSAGIVSGKPLTVYIKLIIKIIADSLIMTHPRCLGEKRSPSSACLN